VQCLHRWNKILKPGLIKGPWTIDEDRKLLEWVRTNGATKWTYCSDFISGRSGKQCRERWFNTLNPNVKKGGWTPKEDFLIFKFFSEFGSKWSLIASQFPGRTENSVKNRFYSTLRRISLDKKKNLSNEKKSNNNNTDIDNNKSPSNFNFNNNNNCNSVINAEFYYGANYSNNQNLPNNNLNNNLPDNNNKAKNNINKLIKFDNLHSIYPTSNLEELMKYLPEAFSEKTRNYFEFKKNEEDFSENFNLNLENLQDLQRKEANEFINNDNTEDKKKFNAVNSSNEKKKIFEASSNNNALKNIRSINEIKSNSGYNNIAPVANFVQYGGLNNTADDNYLGNLNSNNNSSAVENKHISCDLLNQKRVREEEKKESVTLVNNIKNTFNFNLNINHNGTTFENNAFSHKSREIIDKSIDSNNKKNTTDKNGKSNFKKKKLDTIKFPKIEELEHLIENFTETTSKENSCETNLNDKSATKNRNNTKTKCSQSSKNPKSKAKANKKSEVENKNKICDASSIEGNKLGYSSISSQKENSSSYSVENSAASEGKEFLFKIPEICSNEEVTKLSLNLMHRTYNPNVKSNLSYSSKLKEKNNFEKHSYQEIQLPAKVGKSNKNKNEEIFKHDALNNLYDQLNNLENILLNTKKQLFNLDKFYYKENNLESIYNLKSNYEIINQNNNYDNLANKTKNISYNLNKLNEGITFIKNLSGNQIAIQASENINSNISNNINFEEILQKYKISDLIELETNRFPEDKELKKCEATNYNKNLEAIIGLPKMDKNALFLQDDLHYLNNNEAENMQILRSQNINANININNLFNSNLFNNYEGQIQDEQERAFIYNMFQI